MKVEQRPPAGSAESLLAGNPCEALEGLPESVTLIPREVSAITKTLMTEAKSSFLRIDPKVLKGYSHTKRVGHYLLGKTLGEGSFAKVKEAMHVLTGEKVAIKVIDKKAARKDVYVRRNLRREARLLQQIHHQNVVQLMEVLETENSYYLVMELCRGGDLMDLLCEKKQLEEKEVRRYIRQVLSAVHYLHRSGILHRDLKIENLLLDESKNIKIIDFGLSNTIGKHGKDQQFCVTQCGSPAYAAPELLGNRKYGPKVDVWSIGVNMYAMLTGSLPFTVEPFNIKALHKKMLNRQINPLPDHVSRYCSDLLKRMLIPEPEERISIKDVMCHGWITEGKVICMESAPYPNKLCADKLNQELLDHMVEKLEFKMGDVIRLVTGNIPNSATATYHLLDARLHHFLSRQRVRGRYAAAATKALMVNPPEMEGKKKKIELLPLRHYTQTCFNLSPGHVFMETNRDEENLPAARMTGVSVVAGVSRVTRMMRVARAAHAAQEREKAELEAIMVDEEKKEVVQHRRVMDSDDEEPLEMYQKRPEPKLPKSRDRGRSQNRPHSKSRGEANERVGQPRHKSAVPATRKETPSDHAGRTSTDIDQRGDSRGKGTKYKDTSRGDHGRDRGKDSKEGSLMQKEWTKEGRDNTSKTKELGNHGKRTKDPPDKGLPYHVSSEPHGNGHSNRDQSRDVQNREDREHSKDPYKQGGNRKENPKETYNRDTLQKDYAEEPHRGRSKREEGYVKRSKREAARDVNGKVNQPTDPSGRVSQTRDYSLEPSPSTRDRSMDQSGRVSQCRDLSMDPSHTKDRTMDPTGRVSQKRNRSVEPLSKRSTREQIMDPLDQTNEARDRVIQPKKPLTRMNTRDRLIDPLARVNHVREQSLDTVTQPGLTSNRSPGLVRQPSVISSRTPALVKQPSITSDRSPALARRPSVTNERSPVLARQPSLTSERSPVPARRTGLASDRSPLPARRASIVSERSPSMARSEKTRQASRDVDRDFVRGDESPTRHSTKLPPTHSEARSPNMPVAARRLSRDYADAHAPNTDHHMPRSPFHQTSNSRSPYHSVERSSQPSSPQHSVSRSPHLSRKPSLTQQKTHSVKASARVSTTRTSESGDEQDSPTVDNKLRWQQANKEDTKRGRMYQGEVDGAGRQSERSRGQDGRSHQGQDGRFHQGQDDRHHQGHEGRSHQGQDGRSHQSHDDRLHQGQDGRSHQGHDDRLHKGQDDRSNQAQDGKSHQAPDGRSNTGQDGRCNPRTAMNSDSGVGEEDSDVADAAPEGLNKLLRGTETNDKSLRGADTHDKSLGMADHVSSREKQEGGHGATAKTGKKAMIDMGNYDNLTSRHSRYQSPSPQTQRRRGTVAGITHHEHSHLAGRAIQKPYTGSPEHASPEFTRHRRPEPRANDFATVHETEILDLHLARPDLEHRPSVSTDADTDARMVLPSIEPTVVRAKLLNGTSSSVD